MANSPAPEREEYYNIEVNYVSVESLHGYNFYHFNIKNTGEGYVDYISVSNKQGESNFYANTESNEIVHPFDSALFNPGFDKEVIMVTKYNIPESKEVSAWAYNYYVPAENVTYSGSKHVAFSTSSSSASDNYYVYNIQAFYSGVTSGNYAYYAVALFTYKGESVCVKLNSIDTLGFSTNEQLDLEQLELNDIIMLRSNDSYGGYNYNDFNLGDAFQTLLIFLLVFGLILGFGIFSAIFFPAMARRKRRRALQENNK